MRNKNDFLNRRVGPVEALALSSLDKKCFGRCKISAKRLKDVRGLKVNDKCMMFISRIIILTLNVYYL